MATTSTLMRSKSENSWFDSVVEEMRKDDMQYDTPEIKDPKVPADKFNFSQLKKQDITQFFHNELQDAVYKIQTKIQFGINHPYLDVSAGYLEILNCTDSEHFYIAKSGEVVRVPEFTLMEGLYLHKIKDVIRSSTFQSLLNQFADSLSLKIYSYSDQYGHVVCVDSYSAMVNDNAWEYLSNGVSLYDKQFPLISSSTQPPAPPSTPSGSPSPSRAPSPTPQYAQLPTQLNTQPLAISVA